MKIGLALAGGGSLGAYQVGILKYLKENNDGSVTRIVKNDKGSLKIQQIKSNSARTIATFDNNMLYIKGFKFIIKNER